MKRSLTLKLLGVVACAVCVPLASAAAQSVDLGSSSIKISNLIGPTVQIDAFGDIGLGSSGSAGNLTLRDADGTRRFSLAGGTADLFVGGGDDDGDVRLTDTDGVTTTIDLNGEFGLVTLGSVDDDGDLWVMDNDPDGLVSIGLDGATGNVTNQLEGEGLVKAWAKIDAAGFIQDCWRCDIVATTRVGQGEYLVPFGPLAADISTRPRLATLDTHGAQGTSRGQISLTGSGSRIAVLTENSSGDSADRGFTVFVF